MLIVAQCLVMVGTLLGDGWHIVGRLLAHCWVTVGALLGYG